MLSRIYKTLLLPFVGREILEAEKEVEHYGFTRKSSVVELVAILVFLGFVSIIIWLTVRVFHLQPVPWSQAFAAVLSLGVAIIAYRQWRAARHEISIDKYYDRLEITNKRLEVLETDKPTPEVMHTFAELDKLEYVIVKYEYGYMSPVLALRAVENFRRLCMDRRGFMEKASYWVNKASYRKITRRVVSTVCDSCRPGPNSQ